MATETLTGTISVKDAANQVAAQAQMKDAEIQALMDKIEESTKSLTDDLNGDTKFRILTATEYLFVRCRIVVETEAIKCKQLLNDSNTPTVLKSFFTKRGIVMAEISAKLTLIRDDLNVLQRMSYSQQFMNSKQF